MQPQSGRSSAAGQPQAKRRRSSAQPALLARAAATPLPVTPRQTAGRKTAGRSGARSPPAVPDLSAAPEGPRAESGTTGAALAAAAAKMSNAQLLQARLAHIRSRRQQREQERAAEEALRKQQSPSPPPAVATVQAPAAIPPPALPRESGGSARRPGTTPRRTPDSPVPVGTLEASKQEYALLDQEAAQKERRPCAHCARQFCIDRVERHELNCSKNPAKKSRKQFDGAKQRTIPTEAQEPAPAAGEKRKRTAERGPAPPAAGSAAVPVAESGSAARVHCGRPPPEVMALMTSSAEEMTEAEVRQALRDRSLRDTGSRAELGARLLAAIADGAVQWLDVDGLAGVLAGRKREAEEIQKRERQDLVDSVRRQVQQEACGKEEPGGGNRLVYSPPPQPAADPPALEDEGAASPAPPPRPPAAAAHPPGTWDPPDADGIEALTKHLGCLGDKELRQLLRSRGLSPAGGAQALRERLIEAISTGSAEPLPLADAKASAPKQQQQQQQAEPQEQERSPAPSAPAPAPAAAAAATQFEAPSSEQMERMEELTKAWNVHEFRSALRERGMLAGGSLASCRSRLMDAIRAGETRPLPLPEAAHDPAKPAAAGAAPAAAAACAATASQTGSPPPVRRWPRPSAAAMDEMRHEIRDPCKFAPKDLRAALRERGLPVTGQPVALRERLLEAIADGSVAPLAEWMQQPQDATSAVSPAPTAAGAHSQAGTAQQYELHSPGRSMTPVPVAAQGQPAAVQSPAMQVLGDSAQQQLLLNMLQSQQMQINMLTPLLGRSMEMFIARQGLGPDAPAGPARSSIPAPAAPESQGPLSPPAGGSFPPPSPQSHAGRSAAPQLIGEVDPRELGDLQGASLPEMRTLCRRMRLCPAGSVDTLRERVREAISEWEQGGRGSPSGSHRQPLQPQQQAAAQFSSPPPKRRRGDPNARIPTIMQGAPALTGRASGRAHVRTVQPPGGSSSITFG